MGVLSIRAALQEVNDDFIVSTDLSSAIIKECFRLRFEVYCLERNFEPGIDGLESDEFDQYSRQVALFHRSSGELVGTVRMIMPPHGSTEHDFPMAHVCDATLLDPLPVDTTVEISRFAISKKRRNCTASASALARLALVQGLVKLSAELGITHWCAVMEPSLVRLLRTTSINFLPIGPLVEYHGVRQPCYNRLNDLLDSVALGQPDLWNYLTRQGSLWRALIRQTAIAA